MIYVSLSNKHCTRLKRCVLLCSLCGMIVLRHVTAHTLIKLRSRCIASISTCKAPLSVIMLCSRHNAQLLISKCLRLLSSLHQ